MNPFVVRNITFPLAQLYAGRRQWRQELRSICKLQWLSADELKQIQLERLRALLRYAARTVPYYSEMMLRNGIKPDDMKHIEQLQKIPLLNKEIINNHLEELHNPNFPVKFYKNTSSGSTGHPVVFYDDGIKAGLGVAEEAWIKLNFGLPLGLPEARFVRLTEETISLEPTFRKRERLINQLILPGMNLSEEVFERTREKVFAFKPRILFGISSASYEFTRFLRDQGIEQAPWKVDLVICWGAPVFHHYVDLLSSFYRCPIVNFYGTREVGHLASTCPDGNLHLHEESRIIEVVKDGKQVSPGESGQIVVTTLKPYAMPMIRYNTYDIGKISPERCPCGRGLTVLKELEGRSGEIIRLSNGRILSPNYFCRLLMSPEFVGAIKQFQVIQTDPSSLDFKLVKTGDFSALHEERLRKLLRDSLGGGVSARFSFVQGIRPLPSGKFQITCALGNSVK